MADAEVSVCEISQSHTNFYMTLGNDSDPHTTRPGRRRQPYGLATLKIRQKRGNGITTLGIIQYPYAHIQSMVEDCDILLTSPTHFLPVSGNPSFAITYIIMALFSNYHASNRVSESHLSDALIS